MTPAFGDWLSNELARRGIDGAAGVERASKGEIPYATVHNWIKNRTRPRPEQLRVLQVVGIKYVDALIAAGILTMEDLPGYSSSSPPLSSASERDLIEELYRRQSDDAQ